MKEKQAEVRNVLPGSIAEECGIESGDVIISINGQKIIDVFDYSFYTTNESLLVEILKKYGEIWEVEIEKDEYEDLGLEFDTFLIDDLKRCANNCIFCFIDQLPKGMRDTLYFKDDDSRMSFLMGNYVTLTNMKKYELDKIIKYKMSPINISVHTTNPVLRVSMLRNKFAGDIVCKIRKLVESGISINCQIVLCRDINDGYELDNTVQDLVAFYPGIKSVSIVPVGITRYRQGLFELMPYDADSSKKIIEQVSKWQEVFLKRYGSRIIYLADEFYIMAGVDMPGYEHYEEFLQIENGVGLISLMDYEIREYLEHGLKQISEGSLPRHVSIATGVSAYYYVNKWVEMIKSKIKDLKVDVYQIENSFFGENVTVTGLITGQDLVGHLKGKDMGSELLISSSMQRSGEDVFLDNYTRKMVEAQLDVKVVSVDNSGKDFVNKLIGIEVKKSG